MTAPSLSSIVVLADVPEGCAGLVASAPPEQVEALVDAFGGRQARINRHLVSAAEGPALATSVAGAPAATAPDNAQE